MNEPIKILIVDDDPSGTQLLITLLGFEGYKGFGPDEWANPLASVEQHRPELVIMDVRLRSRDGVELVQQLRSAPNPAVASTPVLMMSAEDHRRRCLSAGANGFLEKPFDRTVLLRTIEEILEDCLSTG
ncbi:MAG TPA: response regulator [Anaerolineae bacterium]|nr:response regulator [Anaerolineae bacterium]